MRDMPELGAELSRMVTLVQGMITMPGLAEGVTEELSGFLELLKMDPDTFAGSFFRRRWRRATGLQAPLFSLLREVYRKNARRHRAGGNFEFCQTIQ